MSGLLPPPLPSDAAGPALYAFSKRYIKSGTTAQQDLGRRDGRRKQLVEQGAAEDRREDVAAKRGGLYQANDFYNQYHLGRIKSSQPVPGTALLQDASHRHRIAALRAGIDARADATAAARAARAGDRAYRHRIRSAAEFDASTGRYFRDGLGLLADTEAYLDDLKQQELRDSGGGGDDAVDNRGAALEGKYDADESAADYAHAPAVQERSAAEHLFAAMAVGDYEPVAVLLRRGCNASVRDAAGRSALHMAWDFWDSEDAGAGALAETRVTYTDAEKRSRTEALIAAILRRSGNTGARDATGATPLHHAVTRNHHAAASMLLASRAPPNARERTKVRRPRRAAAAPTPGSHCTPSSTPSGDPRCAWPSEGAT